MPSLQGRYFLKYQGKRIFNNVGCCIVYSKVCENKEIKCLSFREGEKSNNVGCFVFSNDY